MKYAAVVITLTFLLAGSVTAVAQTNKAQGAGTASPSPAMNQAVNKNQVTTQNQGEDTQLQIQANNEEKEAFGEDAGDGIKNRNQNAYDHMSLVAEEVERLLAEDITGGIGQQIREIAQAQKQAQASIEGQFTKLKAKTGILKTLFGPDFQAIKNLNGQIEQNQLRIQELQQLAQQVQNQAEETQIQAAIQAMIEQNTVLQNQVQAEERVGSIFGWLVKMFNN